MEDIYDDLENYDDVDLVNQLRTENAELKHKLGECNSSMQQLQKDFDKLSAEFKTLETNYSSLLKIARTEIKRKTDMISNLNVEKDMLVIKAMQGGPQNVQKLIRDVQTQALKPKKKKRNKGAAAKDRDAFVKIERERPPSSETSSTATDNNNQMSGKELVMETMTASNRYTSEQEVHNPDHMADGIRSPLLDRRVSTLSRQRFSKLSSDEEFEDMYSALEPAPAPSRGPDRSRKRIRDEPPDTRAYYNTPGPRDKPSSYPDPFRESFNKNRTNRLSESDRNINRDRYNDSQRFVNREKYDYPPRRLNPERRRKSVRERDYSGDRYPQQDRHRRLESPPRQRHQHRSRERRGYRSRERDEDRQDIHQYNYTDPHRHKIHDDYDEPQNKRPRLDYPNHPDERRHIEKQLPKEIYSRESRVHSCQSPDFSHTENESCNESVREIRSTASTIIEDPRLNSSKYVKRTEGDKDVLCTANSNKTDLQPVNKSLWNLQDVEVPKALTIKPLEISEEHVERMEADKPLSIVSMESGELGSEITDTFMDDFNDLPEVNEDAMTSYKNICNKNDSKVARGKNREKSPVETTKDVECKSVETQKEFKQAKNKSAKSETASKPAKADEHLEIPPKDGNKDKTKTRRESTELPSVLHKLIKSVRDIPDSPDRFKAIHLSKDTNVMKLKRIPKLKISNKPEKDIQKSTEEKEHKTESGTSNKSDKGTSKNKGGMERKSLRENKKSDMPDMETSKRSEGNDLKSLPEFKALDSSEKERPKCTDEREVRSLCESRISYKTQKELTACSEGKETSNRSEKDTTKIIQEKDLKKLSVLKKIDRAEKEISKITDDNKSLTLIKKDCSNKEIENDASVSIFREFEHRVYSTRNIVEGDLELSDESNDEMQIVVDEKVDEKKKQKTEKKRDASKEKRVDSEENTRKTRSKKDKEKGLDTKNKLSELFGDSSSLITPEELVLATREAHALPAECCPPLCEDAQDGIVEIQTKQLDNILQSKGTTDSSGSITEDKQRHKTKDDKSRTLHKKYKNTESSLVSKDTRKTSNDLPFIGATEQNDDTRSILSSEVKLVLPNEKLKEMQKAKMSSDTIRGDSLKQSERSKETVKSHKKRREEKRLSTSEPPEEGQLKKTNNAKQTKTQEPNSNMSLVTSDNKENTSCNDNSEANISGEMARIFEDTMIPSNFTSVDSSQVSEERLLPIEKNKLASAAGEDGLNLAPVVDEPGLVKTVVISTGVQPLDSNIVLSTTPLNALATSTPAKEHIANTSSEMDPKIHPTTVNVTIASEDSVSQPETDAPDMRITYYKRRRKVLKR